MTVEGKLLIDELAALSASRSVLSGEQLDRLKALFLMVTSSAPETVGDIDNLSYEAIPMPSAGGEHTGHEYSGLTIKSYGGFLSDAITELFELDVEASNLALDRASFRTLVQAMLAIARSLEWFSHAPSYAPEGTIRATLSSLNSHRETGEP